MNRRSFLWNYGGGLGGIALASLLQEEGLLAAESKGLHHPAKAKRVIQLFMSGAASQCDTSMRRSRSIPVPTPSPWSR